MRLIVLLSIASSLLCSLLASALPAPPLSDSFSPAAQLTPISLPQTHQPLLSHASDTNNNNIISQEQNLPPTILHSRQPNPVPVTIHRTRHFSFHIFRAGTLLPGSLLMFTLSQTILELRTRSLDLLPYAELQTPYVKYVDDPRGEFGRLRFALTILPGMGYQMLYGDAIQEAMNLEEMLHILEMEEQVWGNIFEVERGHLVGRFFLGNG